MRCKTCEYPLWNMGARRCPECGRGFSPVDYTFTPNSVKFCCPHCRQDYYGTTVEGHLEPSAFVCVACGQGVSEAEMIVLPAAGVSEETTRGGVVPWRDRSGRYPWIGGWFRTVGQALFVPNRLARSAGQEVRLGAAWGFFLTTTFVYWVCFAALIFVIVVYSRTSRLGIQLSLSDIMETIMVLGLWGVGGPVAMGVVTLIWAGSAHLLLMRRNRMGFGATLESFLYASAGMAPMAVPCLGFYLGPAGAAWMGVSAILQVRIRQSVDGGRATLAVLALPACCVAGGVVLIAWLMFRADFSTPSYTTTTYYPPPAPAATPAQPPSAPLQTPLLDP